MTPPLDTPAAVPVPAVPAPPDAYAYAGAVLDVTDGDTVRVRLTREVDLGFGVRAALDMDVKLRLAGIDAAPLKTPNGAAARAWLSDKTDRRPLHVVTVKNRLGADAQEKYGRYLAHLFVVGATGVETPSLNSQMVAAGLAAPWDGRGPHPTA